MVGNQQLARLIFVTGSRKISTMGKTVRFKTECTNLEASRISQQMGRRAVISSRNPWPNNEQSAFEQKIGLNSCVK